MTLIPPLALLSLSAGVGLYLGYQFLNRRRNKPALIALHILLGLGALEPIALILRVTPGSAAAANAEFGKAAAVLLIIAIIIGLLTPILSRDKPRAVALTALTAHVLVAAAGFVSLIAWFVLS